MEVHKKNNIYGELPKRGGVDNLQGAWSKIGRVFLKGVDTSMRTDLILVHAGT